MISKFKSGAWWGNIAAAVTFYAPGIWLLDLTMAQIWGLTFLIIAVRILIEGEKTQ